jgi:hypothetical protein
LKTLLFTALLFSTSVSYANGDENLPWILQGDRDYRTETPMSSFGTDTGIGDAAVGVAIMAFVARIVDTLDQEESE